MPAKDKLKSLLSKQERKVPDAVRLVEMNRVRNYNRDQQKRVYESEIRQVAAEQEAIKPASAKDIGSAFKLQVYILKLNQILQLKQETYQSLGLALEGTPLPTAAQLAATRQGTAAERQAAQGVVDRILRQGKLSKLQARGSTEGALATQFFSKADLLAAFNEMMAFVKTYMPDLTGDDRQMQQVNAAYFTPLKDLLIQVQGLYPNFFETMPEPPAARQNVGDRDRQTYELLRQQSMYMYALLGCMADFLEDENLRPIVASDVSLFIKENNVRQIFVSNPLGDGVRSQIVDINIRAQQEALQRAAAQQAADAAAQQARAAPMSQQLAERAQQGLDTEAAEQARQQLIADAAAGVQQRMPPVPPDVDPRFVGYNARNAGASARIAARGFTPSQRVLNVPSAMAEYAAQRQTMRVPDNQVFRNNLADNRDPTIRFVGNNDYSTTQITNGIRQFVAGNPQFKQIQGRPPAQPPGQQAGPAAAAAADLRAHSQGAEIVGVGDVAAAMNAAGRERALLARLVPLVKRVELAQNPPRIMSPSKPADVQEVLREIGTDQALQNEMDALVQGGQDQVNFIRAMLTSFRDTRAAYAQTEARDANEPGFANQQNRLYGQGLKSFVEKKGMFPSKMNPKHVAHFMKLNLKPEMIFKLMKKHGIRDGALMEEMEGSGIFDDIMHYGSKALDSVKSGAKDVWKGVKDNVKDALPSMSDVRRGISDIVPDQYKKHIPDSLQTTMFDKAKNFFGFGFDPLRPSENGGIPTRHREPFTQPATDKYGYRQGAAERMRIMPVDMELTSGLGRLRGGDQLRDTDPEVMRRQDHHDVFVTVAHDQPMHGYGVDGDEDDGMQGGLKQRLMGMPLAMFAHRGGQKSQFMPMFSGAELDPYADKFEGGAEGFYEEEEKPYDHDENPTPFRVRDENYKVNTGRLKKVTYKE
jgi:hypothetical protein